MDEQNKFFSRSFSIILAIIVCCTMLLITPEKSYASAKSPSKVVLTSVKSADYNAIKITWKKAKNAKKYQVYRAVSPNGKYKLIKTTTARSFTNKKLTTGKKYYYKVRAINGSKKGKFSKIKYAIPRLKQVTELNFTATENTVKLTWNEVNGAKWYQVYRAYSKNGTYKKVTTTTNTYFTNKGLSANKGYYYKVRAYKKSNGKYRYGKFSTAKYIKTKDHNFNGTVTVVKAPTCTEVGYNKVQCTRCTSTTTVTVAKKAHDFRSTEVVVKEPTCTEAGKKTIQCLACSAVTEKTINPTNHKGTTYTVNTVAPTCEDEGYTVMGCSKCNETWNANPVKELGHDWFVEKLDGGVYEEQCSRCNASQDHEHKLETVYREKTDDEAKLGHWEKYEITYYGCLECGGQLITKGETELTDKSDPALLNQYQTAHNKFHEPDGVVPEYGWVVAETSEPVFVGYENNQVIVGKKCTGNGCDYFEEHSHNYSGDAIELPVEGKFKYVGCDTVYRDKLNCKGCVNNHNDCTVYRDSTSHNNHVRVHFNRRENVNGSLYVYDVTEWKYNYISESTAGYVCQEEGCYHAIYQ